MGADLAHGLISDFSEHERQAIFRRINIHEAVCHQAKPKALWIFGPPAVGKSTICNDLAQEMFGCPENAVTVDGAEFRAEHKGFQRVTEHGLLNHFLHADAWKKLKGTGCIDCLKEEIVQMAIDNRQHLKIPETALNTKRVNCMMEQLIAAGYEVHAACLWAPKRQTEVRGLHRSLEEGKAFTTAEYDKAVKNALDYGKEWVQKIAEGSSNYKSVEFYDNTVFPSRQVRLSEFMHLTQMSDRVADQYAAGKHAEKAWSPYSWRLQFVELGDLNGVSDVAVDEKAVDEHAQEAWTPHTWQTFHRGGSSRL